MTAVRPAAPVPWAFHDDSAYTVSRPPRAHPVAPPEPAAFPDGGVRLPRPDGPLTVTLEGVLGRRRSRRAFLDAPVAVAELGRWLHGAGALQGAGPVPGQPGRPYPSAGALYPTRLHVAALNVSSLPRGVYAYDPAGHALHLTSSALDGVGEALDGGHDPALTRAAAVAFMAADLEAPLRKYGPRGYRFALQESGHLAQNLLLMAAAQGLSAVPLGSFMDDRSAELLRLAPGREVVLYAVAVGRPVPADVDVELERAAVMPDPWAQWRLDSPDPRPALSALYRALQDSGPERDAWFLFKGDGGLHARLRVQPRPGESVAALRGRVEPVLADLQARGLLDGVARGTYEPETGLFGGPAALRATHGLFAADSELALQVAGRPGAEVTLISQLWTELTLRALSLDPFERWDVWRQVRAFRPGRSERWAAAEARFRPALRSLHGSAHSALAERLGALLPGAPRLLRAVSGWGEDLQALHRRGEVEGGVRAVAARCVLFHWNRLWFDPAQQAFLAQARVEASAPDGSA